MNKIDSNGILLKHLGTVHTHEKSIIRVIFIPHDEFIIQQIFMKKCIDELEFFQNETQNRLNLDNILFEFKNIQEIIDDITLIIMKSKKNRENVLYFHRQDKHTIFYSD